MVEVKLQAAKAPKDDESTFNFTFVTFGIL